MNNDTICALATPTGGAIAIIRLSGPDTYSIIPAICSRTGNASARLHREDIAGKSRLFVHIIDEKEELIDEVLVSLFHAPHSYTGEDAAEISCHGSAYIARRIIELLVKNGCSMAQPGEFTQRAFLNGKMDLSQAEAVADLINSQNRATHHIAMSQLRGHFSSELSRLREHLLHLTTLLELELDFSDHEDLEFADRTELQQLAHTIEERITYLARSFETGQALKQGIPVAIIGKTNVGKSTLLNRLLRDERAIVSDLHGTTRDTIEDTIDIHGIQFRFIDTAGIRQTSDVVEQIGIQRTYEAIRKAHIILWVLDSLPDKTEIDNITSRIKERILIPIWNKIDRTLVDVHISSSILNPTPIKISAKTGQGINELEQAIYQAANIPELQESDIIVTNARHYEALTQASVNLKRVITGLKDNLSGDLIAEDLRLVLSDLGEITGGTITSQETLNNVFSHFCIGK